MAIVNQPTSLSNELAWNGDKNPIPDTNDGSKGLFSVEYGFPYVTQQPLAQGGIPPQRNDFNGVLNLLSKFIRYFQNGGIFAYSSAMDYSVGMLVRNGDRLYVCKAENGANTPAGVQNISNSNYWNEITLEDTLGDTLTNQLKTVLVTEAEVANNTTDWNSLTESRTYKISGATFSATYHQPVGANGNGELVVLKNGTDTIVQVYYANSTQPDQAGAYHRIYFGGAWTNWIYDITNQGGTINGNLNVDGNLGVTGNSNINGKLTVDSIEISNQLTIGGAPPLGQDAIDKLQAQIIAPSQTLYVSNNGSDETGDGTITKPYKTIDFTATKINYDVPTVTIVIDNDCENLNYSMHPIDFQGKQTESFNITITDWEKILQSDEFKPKLTINKGKAFIAYHGSIQLFGWGNFIASNIDTVSISGMNIYIGDDYTKYYPIGFLLYAKNVYIHSCIINATDYSLQVNNNLNNVLKVDDVNLDNYSGLLFGDLSRITASSEEPAVDSLTNSIFLNSIPTTLQAIVYGGTTIPSIVLDYSLGERGIDNKVTVLYKNWS
jgi:hypothetical protein